MASHPRPEASGRVVESDPEPDFLGSALDWSFLSLAFASSLAFDDLLLDAWQANADAYRSANSVY